MIKPLYLDDEVYTRPVIDGFRNYVIQVRDAALDASHMESAIVLSKVIALLGHLRDNTDE